MTDYPEYAQFQPLLKQSFVLTQEDGSSQDVTLVEVTQLKKTFDPPEYLELKVREIPFSLVFKGPKEQALNQGNYSLSHPETGDIPPLMMVPINENQDSRFYEAIFN